MKNKTIWIIIVVIGLILGAYFAKGQNQSGNDNANKKIKIGIVAPLSGPFGTFKEDILAGASDVFNDKYEIIAEDDMCDPVKSVSAYKKLIEVDKVKYIIGPTCGSSQEAIVSLVKDKSVVVILPTAASNSLYNKSAGNVFNSQYSLEQEAEFMANLFNNKGYKNIGLIKYSNAFSLTTTEAFKSKFNGKITELNYVDFNSDVTSEITKNKNNNFDAIFVTDISFFFASGIQKLQQNGIKTIIYAQNSVDLPSVKPLAKGVFYSYPEDINTDKGMVYGLTQSSGLSLKAVIEKCGLDTDCVKKKLIDSKRFDSNGIRIQNIILKEVTN